MNTTDILLTLSCTITAVCLLKISYLSYEVRLLKRFCQIQLKHNDNLVEAVKVHAKALSILSKKQMKDIVDSNLN